MERSGWDGNGGALVWWRRSTVLVCMSCLAVVPMSHAASVGRAQAQTAVFASHGAQPADHAQAIDGAAVKLGSCVRRAHQGALSQRELRATRIAIEATLARTVARLPAITRPEDIVILLLAQSRLNQIIIRSQEWEVFGATPRPEWGWDPERETRAFESGFVGGEQVIAGEQVVEGAQIVASARP